jgi:queuine/archaeosine tRNA-ribosyltransferase
MVSAADIARRPYLERAVAARGLKHHLGVCGPLMIDSGGFSLMTGGTSDIAIGDLIRLYRSLDADVLTTLDVPPMAHDDVDVRAAKWRKTLRHLDRMLCSLDDERLMPVIHGWSLSEISRACRQVRSRISCPVMLGLGGMVPFLRGMMCHARFCYRRPDGDRGSAYDFVADAIALCRSEFPSSRLHVFGVGAPTTAIALLALGADSVDSLAWRRAAGYGTIFLAGCAERIVSERPRQRFSRPGLSRGDRCALSLCTCPVCREHVSVPKRINTLASSYMARGVHNVWTLLTEESALRSAVSRGRLPRFLASRISDRHRFSGTLRARFKEV